MKLKGLQLARFNVYKSSISEMHKRRIRRENGNIGILVGDDWDALVYQKLEYRSHRACRSLTGGICVSAISVGVGDITEQENKSFMDSKRKQGVRAIKLMRGTK